MRASRPSGTGCWRHRTPRGLDRFGVDNGYMATSRMNIAKWYNAPPDDPRSCCALAQPVTEFGCQGLELDLPILCWGPDVMWRSGQWQLSPVRRRYRQTDPQQLVINTYRVLLTRGRDGVVIWVPPMPILDETEHILLAAGVRGLPAASAIVGGEIESLITADEAVELHGAGSEELGAPRSGC